MSTQENNQSLTPYLYCLLARERGAIGIHSSIHRTLAMPGNPLDSIELISRNPDLEILGVLSHCALGSIVSPMRSLPSGEVTVVAYELVNNTANPCSIGFIRRGLFGTQSITERVNATYSPILIPWTMEALQEHAENNPINWLF